MALNTEESKIREMVINLSSPELGEIVRTAVPLIECLKMIERNHNEDKTAGWSKWLNMLYNLSHEELVTRAMIGDSNEAPE